MTALCGGGPSGPQSGVGGVLTLGAAAIEVFISSVLLLPEIAPVLAPIIAGIVDIDLAVYCGTDPPADPGLTAADVGNAIAFPPHSGTFTAQQKILTWFEARYWYQICQCTGTTTPGPGTPSNPGQVSSNSGLPSQSTPCWTVSVPWSIGAPVSGVSENITDLTPTALPVGAVTLVTLGTAGSITWQGQSVPMPIGSTQLAMDGTFNEAVVSSTGTVAVSWSPYNSSGALLGTDRLQITNTHFGLSSGNIYTAPTLGPSEVTRTVWVLNTDTVAHTGTVNISFFCPPGTNVGQPCCPPDPILEGELQQILQYVQAIYAGLPIPPTSFAEGTVHSGLTGSGSITFSAVPIALKVDLTTIPSWIGRELGNPEFYFDVGYLAFGTSEGSYAQTRLELEHQVVTVPVLAGSVGYTLENGVIASITELLPGP